MLAKNHVRMTVVVFSALVGLAQAETQVVFLDFDSGDAPNTLPYSQELRQEIQGTMQRHYDGFDVEFALNKPATGPFAQIVFNEGGGGGLAEDGIDFRNLNRSDRARVNVFPSPYNGASLSDEDLVTQTANVASHELGHMLGLNHDDRLGPIGAGIQDGTQTIFEPDYPGPRDADTRFSLMDNSSPVFHGTDAQWFTARSSVKLALTDGFATTQDAEENDTVSSAQPLSYQNLRVPNRILDGPFAGSGDFSYSAVVVEGSLGLNEPGDPFSEDWFQLEGGQGELLNIEVISTDIPRIVDDLPSGGVDTQVSVHDSAGNLVDYYGVGALNNMRPFGIFGDPAIVDLNLANDDDIFVKVTPDGGDFFGNYELLVHRFNGVLGDANCDNQLDLTDVQPFVDALVLGDYVPKLDINLDGSFNLRDVQPFFDLLSGNAGSDTVNSMLSVSDIHQLLRSVPEPSGLLLMALALTGEAFRRRRNLVVCDECLN